MAATSASKGCMGGVHVEEALKILDGSATRYLPFAGAPSGHPTRLGGSAPEVEAQCRAFARQGCAGVDILAYRATEAEPLDLVAACRRGFLAFGTVVVAGSINSPSASPRSRRRSGRLHHRRRGDRRFLRARAGPLAAQLQAVLADCGSAGDAWSKLRSRYAVLPRRVIERLEDQASKQRRFSLDLSRWRSAPLCMASRLRSNKLPINIVETGGVGSNGGQLVSRARFRSPRLTKSDSVQIIVLGSPVASGRPQTMTDDI